MGFLQAEAKSEMLMQLVRLDLPPREVLEVCCVGPDELFVDLEPNTWFGQQADHAIFDLKIIRIVEVGEQVVLKRASSA